MSNWIKSLSTIENVAKIHNLRDLISIEFRDGRTDLIAYKNNKNSITVRALDFLIKEKKFNFLLCFNEQYNLDSSCIELLKKSNISYGNANDFGKILRNSHVEIQNFITPETDYILNNLPNHDNVTSVELIANRKILIKRKKGRDINLVFLDEYELSNARITEIFQYYTPIDIILSTNPNIIGLGTLNFNGNIVQTVKWKELFSLLKSMP